MSPSRRDPRGPGRRRVLLGVKLSLTAALCTVLAWNADWGSLWESARSASVPLLLVVVALMTSSVTISAYKWQLLLELGGARVPFRRLHRFYFTAGFMNNFFPSSIGGDGYRIYRTLEVGRKGTTAIFAVVLERASGLLVLLVLGFAAAAVVWLRTGDAIAATYLLLGSGAIAGSALTAAATMRFDLVTRLRAIVPDALGARLTAAASHLGALRGEPGKALWALVGVSLGFHLHTIFFYGLLLIAVGEALPLAELALVLALTTAVGLVPVTINGIGLLDGTFVYLATHFGVGYEAALSAMLIVRGVTLMIGLVGAFFYLTEGADARKSPEAAIGRLGLESPSTPVPTAASER